MLKRIKYLNLCQIICNILMFILLILVLIQPKVAYYDFYWFILGINFIGNLAFVMKWCKRGLDVEKKESKSLFRSLDDGTTATILIYSTLYTFTYFVDEYFSPDMRKTLIFVVISFVITLLCEWINYVLVDRAMNGTVDIVKDKLKGKK